MRFVVAAVCVLAASLGIVGTIAGAPGGRFTERGTVTYVGDGDTVDVRLANGKRERVRVLGIDTPERGACHFRQASAQARRLALGKRVVLRGDATQDTRDRYGRLLAYVWLPGGKDLGYRLVRDGFARVYVFERPFRRVSAYRRAERVAQRASRGLWKACGDAGPKTIAQPPNGIEACREGYSPCLPVVGDLDCADVRALGKAPVRVSGSDPYRLDGDGDGWGCE
jgi:endonuclease YncB( thermonuclease family)